MTASTSLVSWVGLFCIKRVRVFSSHLPVEREPGGHDLHERLHELVDVEDPAGGTGACGDAEAAVPGFKYRLLVNL